MSMITLKPAILVSLSVRRDGGVSYSRVDLDADRAAEDRRAVERWETTKVVSDPEEFRKASKVQSRCRALIAAVCTKSAFGLLCPLAYEKKLGEAIAAARAMAESFNQGASTCRVSVYVLRGHIASTDEEAVSAISSDMRDLMDSMKSAIGAGDVEAIRKAASEAKKFGRMLDDEASKKVTAAIEEARGVAREMVKKLLSQEPLADYIQQVRLQNIESARASFLDLDEARPITAPTAAPLRVVDLPDDPGVARAS